MNLAEYDPKARRRRLGQPGFTVLELSVVLGCIAIVIGLLLPALKTAQNVAQATACQSNLHQIYIAFQGYQAEQGGVYPMTWGNWKIPVVGARGFWYNSLLGQGISGPGEAIASSNPYVLLNGGGGTNYLGDGAVLHCPGGAGGGSWLCSTTIQVNYAMSNFPIWYGTATTTDGYKGRFFPQLRKPSGWPLVMDATNSGSSSWVITGLDNPVATAPASSRYMVRHGHANILMVDGSIVPAQYGNLSWKQSVLNDGAFY